MENGQHFEWKKIHPKMVWDLLNLNEETIHLLLNCINNTKKLQQPISFFFFGTVHHLINVWLYLFFPCKTTEFDTLICQIFTIIFQHCPNSGIITSASWQRTHFMGLYGCQHLRQLITSFKCCRMWLFTEHKEATAYQQSF